MDWKIIIQELQAAGLTQQQIAAACDTGQSHVSSLARGDRLEPRWGLGDRLLKLHREHVTTPHPLCGGGEYGVTDRRVDPDRRAAAGRRHDDGRRGSDHEQAGGR